MSPPWQDFQVTVCPMISSVTFRHSTVYWRSSHVDLTRSTAVRIRIHCAIIPNATFFPPLPAGVSPTPRVLVIQLFLEWMCIHTWRLGAKNTRLVLNCGFSLRKSEINGVNRQQEGGCGEFLVLNNIKLIAILQRELSEASTELTYEWGLQAALTFPSSPSMRYSNGKIDSLRSKANWLISSRVILEIVSAGWMIGDRDGEF